MFVECVYIDGFLTKKGKKTRWNRMLVSLLEIKGKALFTNMQKVRRKMISPKPEAGLKMNSQKSLLYRALPEHTFFISKQIYKRMQNIKRMHNNFMLCVSMSGGDWKKSKNVLKVKSNYLCSTYSNPMFGWQI